MVKNFLIAMVCLLSFGIYAQNSTISPYSFFGFGDTRNNGTIENRMMGGLQMYADSIHLNLNNPAALGGLKLTAYTVGISHREFRLKDNTANQRTSVTNLEYLAVGFPVTKKAAMAFGLQPFSSVGYGVVSEAKDADGNTVRNAFSGSGGLNKVFVAIGYEPFKDFTLGAMANFSFGNLAYNRTEIIEGRQFGTFDNRDSRVNGFDFNLGANYTKRVKGEYTLYSHLGIDTQVNLVSENKRTIGSLDQNGRFRETVNVNLHPDNLKYTELKIPTKTTLGLGFGEERKWFLGAEYATQAYGGFENRFLGQDNVQYQDASSVAVGGYYIPNYAALSGVLNRVTYRAGLRYDQTGLLVNGKEINDFGITFGFGVPIVGTGTDRFSNLNVGFELGRRGTRAAGLLEESYLNINIGLSLNDRWFVKRKIN